MPLIPPPHTRITRHNFERLSPSVLDSINQASTIALDCEFSGLGSTSNSHLRSPNIRDRYSAMADIVARYSLLSFGLCIVVEGGSGGGGAGTDVDLLQCHNYEFVCLSHQERGICCDADSLGFLVASGFDLNALALDGIPFVPAGESDHLKSSNSGGGDEVRLCSRLLRDIFSAVARVSRESG
eukprot:Partr_v1_DN25722_c0_g1_i1_m74757